MFTHTKEELDVIWARWEAATPVPQQIGITYWHSAPWKAEREFQKHAWEDMRMLLVSRNELEAERDQWKERFKHEVRGLCDYCINRNDEPHCKHFQNNKCDWQFDEARFVT